MQNKNEILSELLEISQLIAEINRENNLYEVPSGYFGSLADKILAHIKTSGLAAKNELEALSPVLSRIDKKNVFTVTENYFEGLPEKILTRLKAANANDASEELAILSPLLSQLDKKIPFSAPKGYFDDLSDNLVVGMQAVEFVNDELKNLSPLMGSISNENVYEVPEGYFNNLAENILQKIKGPQQEAKIISFRKRKAWLKYAVAASVTGILLTVGFLTFNKQNTTTTIVDPAAGISKVSDQEISNYLDNHDVPLDESNNNSIASLDFNDNDITDLLGDVPDNELQQYAIDQPQAGSKDLITN